MDCLNIHYTTTSLYIYTYIRGAYDKFSDFFCMGTFIDSTHSPRGVMVKAMDCGIVVSEFVFQSRYYVHFRANTLGKSMNPLILLAMA